MDPARRIVHALPPVRRRDEQIRDLKQQLRTAQQKKHAALERVKELERLGKATGPSFIRRLESERRLAGLGNSLGSAAPRHKAAQKLRAQAMARGCGVAVPEVFAAWPDAESVDLAGLPDEFVLKSVGGAGSYGVFPLRRRGDLFEVVSLGETVSQEEMVARLADLVGRRTIRAPFFAEEFLHGTTGSEIPNDIKVYAFYGVVGHVQLRTVARHGDLDSVSSRYVDREGRELSDMVVGRRIDLDIPIPDHLAEVVDAAERLSVATRLAFVRVDFFETARGIVFGELTPRPGGAQRFEPEHDRWLGELWEEAQARLDRDVADGTPLAHDLGGHEGDPYVDA